jgi:regulation of enolase protein 1 (concanavalin A-like superfamily)
MEWYNEPQSWSIEGERIVVTSDPKTDFWRKTHYGFIRDSGHFYFEPVSGDFEAEVKVSGAYRAQYDQAGLMVRLDEQTWLKTGIEFVDGIQYVSAVVTRDYSDWSVTPLAENPPALWLRVGRHGSALEVNYSVDGTRYTLLRQAYLTAAATVSVGIMCASPDGEGFRATFEGLRISGV